ncbi:50S ribosomal protein L30 [Candidatus Bathyarchaeota archaeon]|nr:50S ribosomal protein L30 [Candidatus Bathyarchaeota archaeon]MBS7628074.1 50S ribosomal protein L30 [Candidatus Bathyarchaeota archaeon]
MAVVRVRGMVNTPSDVEETLKRLRLKKVNTCVLVQETPEYMGMLQKVKDRVAYGIIDSAMLYELLRKRGRLVGDRPLTEEGAKELGFQSLRELAEALVKGSIKISNLKGLKPFFRLHPPSGGYGSVKKPYPDGALGNWGKDISKLLKRMI